MEAPTNIDFLIPAFCAPPNFSLYLKNCQKYTCVRSNNKLYTTNTLGYEMIIQNIIHREIKKVKKKRHFI